MIIDSPIISGSQNASGPLTQIGNVEITGSLSVTGTINGSITGSVTSASYATSAEFLDGLDSTSFVFTSSFNTFSGSAAGRITNLEAFSSSLDTVFATDASVTASILVLSGSVQASQAALSSSYTITSGSYANASASLSTRVTTNETNITTLTNASASFAAQSASLSTRLTTDESNFNTTSGSLSTRVTNLESTSSTVSSSFATTSGSISGRVTLIEGQYATTGSNVFTGPQFINQASNAISFTSTASLYTDGGLRVSKDSFVSGTAYFNNVVVYGTSSIQYITSSQVNFGTNIITVNTDTPAVRFGGLAVFDSGSTQLTGSMLWDSERNHWVYSNPSGSSYSGGMLMSGPRSSALGSEQGTTSCAIMIGQGGDHITSSMIYSYGNATCFYGNSYIDSSGNSCQAGYAVVNNCLGIGTASPSVYGVDASNASNSVYFKATSNATTAYYGAATALGTGVAGTFSNHDFALYANSIERARITSTGIACFACQVCVPNIISTGTSGGRYGTFNAPTNGGYITFEAGGTPFGDLGSYCAQYGTGDATTFLLGSRTGYALSLGTNSTERIRIESGGDIRINMPNSTQRTLSWYSANGVYQVAGIASCTHPSFNDAGYLIFSTAKTSSGGFTEKMRIEPNGNVGIANTSPSSFLQLGTYASSGKYIDSATLPNTPGNYLITLTPPSTTNYYGGGIGWSEGTNTAAAINAFDDGATGALGLSISTGTNSCLAEKFRITSTGVACFACQVCAPAFIGGVVSGTTLCTSNGIIGNNSNNLYLSSNSSASEISFWGNQLNTRLMTILGNGCVGIGCSSPGAQLVVYGACNGDTTLHVQNGSVSGKISFSNNTANAIYGGGWYGYMGYNSATYHYFGQCIVAPKLHINTPDGCGLTLQYGANSGYAGISTDAANNLIFKAYIGTEYMRIRCDGNVGIGTNTPNETLDVNGTIQVRGSSLGYATTQCVTQLDFYAGAARILSFGGNSTTCGGFRFYSAGQNNSGGSDVATISGGGVACFASNVCIGNDAVIKTDLRLIRSGVSPALVLGNSDQLRFVSETSGNSVALNVSAAGTFLVSGVSSAYTLNSTQGCITSNGVITYSIGGTMAGTTATYYDFPTWNDGAQGQMFEVKAFFDHFYNWAYGAHYYVYLTTRETFSQALTMFNCTTGNGGSWMAYKPNNTTLRVCKLAGSYGGGGAYWIQVTAKQP